MTIAFPKPDEAVLARRQQIIEGLGRLVAPEALIVSEDERRAFETDGLTAYRQMPLAVVLPSTAYGRFGAITTWLPSGALGDALRAGFWSGDLRWHSVAVLGGWAILGAVLTARTFRWE